MKKITAAKSLLLTACAVSLLSAANQSWADTTVQNCTQVTVATETDSDSQPGNFDGITPQQDDEFCAAVTIVPIYDFGDAPDSYGTTITKTGAQHEIIPGLKLGATVDNESDGQPNVNADGDGTDEDGVTIPPLMDGDALTLSPTVTNTTGKDATLGCWIDYNGDGVFATDNSEYGGVVVPSNMLGEQTVNITMPTVPLNASKDTKGISYARCRLSTDTVDSAKAVGALVDGEVEDYKVTFTAQPVFDLALRKRLATGQATNVKAGGSVQFTIDVINQGTVNASNIVVTDYIPVGMELADTNWTASADGTTATLNTPIAALPSTQSQAVGITLKVKSSTTAGDLTNTAEISAATGGTDQDSTPDNNPSNESPVKDDEVTEDGKKGGDEDDHDIAKVTVDPTIDLELSKTAVDTAGNPVTTVHKGDIFTYVLTLINKGIDVATGVKVSDNLPTGVTYLEDDGAGAYVPGTGVWTVGNVPVGMTKLLKIKVKVEITTSGSSSSSSL